MTQKESEEIAESNGFMIPILALRAGEAKRLSVPAPSPIGINPGPSPDIN